jgi:hypothetical protein
VPLFCVGAVGVGGCWVSLHETRYRAANAVAQSVAAVVRENLAGIDLTLWRV